MTTWIDRMETTLDRPIKPTARRRQRSSPAASVVASRPAKRPTGLARLQAEWNGLVARDDSLTDRCVEVNALVESLKAERKSAPPSLRRDVDTRLAEAYREMERLGAECRRVESRMEELKTTMGR